MLLVCGCFPKKEIRFAGQTMGTTYHIKVVTGYFKSLSGMDAAIKKRLDEINQSMSTYLTDSEISRFNALKTGNRSMAVSDDFFSVMTVAKQLYTLTGGAWDGTVYPLIALWGFASSAPTKKIPSDPEVQEMLSRIGFDGIELSATGQLSKKNPAITLDLASIAKGFAVDAVADLIKTYGTKDFLVEIGGEVYASGSRKDGSPWRIGVNMPRPDAPADQVYKAMALQDQAMATSGDYRNYFESQGRRYSHIINPKTGYPVDNGVVSATVLSDTCTFADGLATALMVLGPEKSIDLVNRLEKVECLIVKGSRDGRLTDYYSKGFREKMPDS